MISWVNTAVSKAFGGWVRDQQGLFWQRADFREESGPVPSLRAGTFDAWTRDRLNELADEYEAKTKQ